VYGGNRWLARQAGYHWLPVGTVLQCEIRRVDGEDRIVYIRAHAKQDPLKQRLTLAVETYSQANGSYRLGGLPGKSQSVSVTLRRAVVEKAGYLALSRGDVATVDVLDLGRSKLATRLVSCDRKIVRDVRGYLGNPVQHAERGRYWPLEILDPSARSIYSKTGPLRIWEEQYRLSEAFRVVPHSACVVVDLQEGSASSWRVAARVSIELVEQGAWQLGRSRCKPQANGKLLAFLRIAKGVEAFIPPDLHDSLGNGAFDGIWFEARICRCSFNGQEKFAVCDIRRPQSPASVTGRILETDNRDRNATVSLEDGRTLTVDFATFQRARLSTVDMKRMPVRCNVREAAGVSHIVDVGFDPERGWDDAVCFLLPYAASDEERVLVRNDNKGRLVLAPRDPFYADLAEALPGSLYSVEAFRNTSGKWRAVAVERETTRIPWVYGFVVRVNRRTIGMRLFGGEVLVIDRRMIGRRDGRDPTIGGLVRLTRQPAPIGMFEYQDSAKRWTFAASILFYDAEKDYGKLSLIADEAIEVRFNVAKLTDSRVPALQKALPVTVSLERIVCKDAESVPSFRSHAVAIHPTPIRALPWRKMTVKEIFSSSSAVFAVETVDGTVEEAYAPSHIATMYREEAPLEVGARFLGQITAGRLARSTVVNIAWLPSDDDLAANCQPAVSEKIHYRQRIASFRLLETGKVVDASPKLFSMLDADGLALARDDILLIETGEVKGNSIATAVLEKLGRVLDFPYSGSGGIDPSDDAATRGSAEPATKAPSADTTPFQVGSELHA
jgi:hypothetical protein